MSGKIIIVYILYYLKNINFDTCTHVQAALHSHPTFMGELSPEKEGVGVWSGVGL